MDLCSKRLLGLKDVLHEADCGVRPRVNPKVLKCCVHYILGLGLAEIFWYLYNLPVLCLVKEHILNGETLTHVD